MNERIAVIGSGLAGLTAAADLAAAGRVVTVFDKGRGLGGRIAVRRRGAESLDHGAAALHGDAPGFQDWCAGEAGSGRLARWDGPGGGWIGVPEMKAPLRRLAEGLDLHKGTRIASVARDGGWHLTDVAGSVFGPFDTVLSTIPAPQAAELFADRPELDGPLAGVEMAPQWVAMFAWESPPKAPDQAQNAGPVEKLVCMDIRPGRSTAHGAWVVHATLDWSAAHLERDGAEVADLLLGVLTDTLGTPLPPPDHAAAHRWRFARTQRPLGAPVLADGTGTLLLGGDWTLGPDAGDAWASGRALARAARDAAFR